MGRTVVQTYSGALVDLVQPDPDTIRIQDIAHHLSLQCRFNGAVKEFYSVAQHSCLVLTIVQSIPMAEDPAVQTDLGLDLGPPRIATREELVWALLHDAAEAYTGDVVSPMRRMVHGLDEAEARLLTAITSGLDIGEKMPPVVSAADQLALAAEARDLLVGGPHWPTRACSWIPTVRPWAPAKARRRFLEHARALGVL